MALSIYISSILVAHAKERSLASDNVERKQLVELFLLHALDNEALNSGLSKIAAKHFGYLLLDRNIFVIMERERAVAA